METNFEIGTPFVGRGGGGWPAHFKKSSCLFLSGGPQIALRWVIQNQVALVVAADKRGYLLEDVDVINWTLSDADFELLSTTPLAPEGPTRGNCVSPTNPESQTAQTVSE